MKKIKTATLPTAPPAKFYLAAAAIVLALLAIPNIVHAQGIRSRCAGRLPGRQPGRRSGGQMCSGGAVGAGRLAGRWAAVKGVFGLSDRGYRCRRLFTIAAVDHPTAIR